MCARSPTSPFQCATHPPAQILRANDISYVGKSIEAMLSGVAELVSDKDLREPKVPHLHLHLLLTACAAQKASLGDGWTNCGAFVNSVQKVMNTAVRLGPPQLSVCLQRSSGGARHAVLPLTTAEILGRAQAPTVLGDVAWIRLVTELVVQGKCAGKWSSCCKALV